ncbi:Fe-S oxidoreductase, partial [Candidatus Pacearchaeota archaeon]|nr:Fe-S oxidoreductase [Candidatus Pacearchaeota archaeon]
YHKAKGNNVKFVVGNRDFKGFKPSEINITSLFTYWQKYVWDSVSFYKNKYPKSKVVVGGIYASLMPEHCKKSGCDEVFMGVHKEAEKCQPDYSILDIDYQIIHTSRGCVRRCKFCGTWRIEPKFKYKKSIKDEICKNLVVFYDNNILANPHIENILDELSEAQNQGRAVYSECQCGIDGRILLEKPHLAKMLKKARMINPRIAWDHGFDDWKMIKKQLKLLFNAGYKPKDTYVFMLYNWDIPFNEMEKKRLKCYKFGVQISDCRYRPLNHTFDEYNAIKEQTNKDYFIHPSWTDKEVKLFRKNVRRHNICVRHKFPFYSRKLEHKTIVKDETIKLSKLPRKEIMKLVPDAWFPDKVQAKR